MRQGQPCPQGLICSVQSVTWQELQLQAARPREGRAPPRTRGFEPPREGDTELKGRSGVGRGGKPAPVFTLQSPLLPPTGSPQEWRPRPLGLQRVRHGAVSVTPVLPRDQSECQWRDRALEKQEST